MIRSVEGNLRISKLTSPNVQCYKNDNTTTTNTTTTTTNNNNNNNKRLIFERRIFFSINSLQVLQLYIQINNPKKWPG